MLPRSLIVRPHLRLRIDAQSSSASPTLVSLFPLSHPLSSNSLRIISFADPHSLNPAESHRYKNVHGRGYLQLADLASFKIPSRIHLFFQSLAQCPSCNSFVLMVFHFHGGGVCVPSSTFRLPTFRRFRPIPSLFTAFRTLLHSPKPQPVCFQAIPHSLPKTPGGGVSPILLELPSRARRPTHGTATIFHQSPAQPASTWSGPCFFSTFNCQPLCVRSLSHPFSTQYNEPFTPRGGNLRHGHC